MNKDLQRANELEREARDIRRAVSESAERAARKMVEDFEVKQNYHPYSASDYAGIRTGDLEFYFGYEEQFCLKHDCDDCECNEREWCFVVKKDKQVMKRIVQSKLYPDTRNEPPIFFLMIGMYRHFMELDAI